MRTEINELILATFVTPILRETKLGEVMKVNKGTSQSRLCSRQINRDLGDKAWVTKVIPTHCYVTADWAYWTRGGV